MEYRYVRWTVTKRKEVATATSIQFSEFELRLGGSTVAWDTATATNPGGSNPGGEGPAQAIDGSVSTKLFDTNFHLAGGSSQTGSSIFVVDAGVGDTFVFDGYRFATANDEILRDPTGWTLEGSANGTDWTLLDTIDDATVTDTRETFTADFTLPAAGPVLTQTKFRLYNDDGTGLGEAA